MSDDISAFLDGELDDTARRDVAAAIAADAALQIELDETREVRDLVRGLAPPALPADFLESMLASVAAADDPDPTAEPAPVVEITAARGRRRGWTRVVAAAAGVAASVAIVAAVALPNPDRSAPALATDVRVHQAGTAAAGDPVSGLAPLAAPLRWSR